MNIFFCLKSLKILLNTHGNCQFFHFSVIWNVNSRYPKFITVFFDNFPAFVK